MKNESIWTLADIPPQTGRLAVVTGTGGLGYWTALALAQEGAEVIVAGRSETKGREAVAKIRGDSPEVNVCFESLDLASLASIRNFADRLLAKDRPIDLLINNAGVMTPPKRLVTVDNFELQFGTNHLGHFALTARLLPLLRRGQQPRVVQVSSSAHKLGGRIHFDDLQWTQTYKPWLAYAQSKLANLLFTFELQRRSDAAGWGLMSNAAHPGYARTELIPNGPGAHGLSWWLNKHLMQPIMSQSAADGAWPTLLAATSPTAQPAGYYGPRDYFEMKGPPVPAIVASQAKDVAVARSLWDVSEKLTGVSFPAAA